MSDPNLKDFYIRLGRIEQIRRRGGGFEAAGAIGLSHYTRQQRRSMPLFRPLLVVFVAIITVKAIIHDQVGAETYAARVQVLSEGSSVDQAGAFIMQADPLTQFVSSQVMEVRNWFR